jgi:chromosome segregation ATPase
MTPTAEVLAAQRALDAAQQREREERRADLVSQLESVTTLLETRRTDFAQLRERVLILRAKRSKLQNAITEILTQIGEHEASKPRVAAHLPTGPAAIRWRQAGEWLETQRAAVAAELAETQAVDSMSVDLARLGSEIQRLEFSQNNLVNALNDTPQPFLSPITEAPQGGLSRVSWR